MGAIKKPDEIVSKKPAAIAVSRIVHDFGRLARYFKNCKMALEPTPKRRARVVDDRDRSARYGSAASRRSSICCRVNRFGRQTSDIPAVYTLPATYPVSNITPADHTHRSATEPRTSLHKQPGGGLPTPFAETPPQMWPSDRSLGRKRKPMLYP